MSRNQIRTNHLDGAALEDRLPGLRRVPPIVFAFLSVVLAVPLSYRQAGCLILLGAKEVAVMLGVHPKTVIRLFIRAGNPSLPAWREALAHQQGSGR